MKLLTLVLLGFRGVLGLHRGPHPTVAPHTEVRCWDNFVPYNLQRQVFFLHTPKAAGCSIVDDLSHMVGRHQIYTQETCFSVQTVGTFETSVMMVRHPREHVFALYQECDQATGPGYHKWANALHMLKGQENHHLPSNFSGWVEEWTEKPHFYDHIIWADKDMCYCPYNLQSARLVCDVDLNSTSGSVAGVNFCRKEIDLDLAVKNMKATTLVGVTEAYHESLCLFHAYFLDSLPAHCHCDRPSWKTYVDTREDHGVAYQDSVEDESEEVPQKLDDLTRLDQALYKATVERFVRDVEEVEKRFGAKILCEKQRQMLHQKTIFE